MPTYQYRCTDCGDQLEVVQKFTDDALTLCPACEGTLRKVFSAVGVVFKGSGFYRNDSRAAADSSASSSSSSDKGTGDGTGSSSSGSPEAGSSGSSSNGSKAESAKSSSGPSKSDGSSSKAAKQSTPAPA